MVLNAFSVLIRPEEIFTAMKSLTVATGQQLPPEVNDVSVTAKGDHLVVSIKKRMGFVPVTLSGTIGLRPAADGDGIVLTLVKVSAGFIGSKEIASQLMGMAAESLRGKPGCSVSGNDITVTKEALAKATPWLSLPGKITRFGVVGESIELTLG